MRAIVPKTVERFFGCGLPEGGFARVRCGVCGNEYLVAFSCKQRGFCPSCSAKRAAEMLSSGYRDYDYLEWIARLTSHIPDRGTQLVHYYGAYSNAHRGIARQREVFVEVPPKDEPVDSPPLGCAWLAARRKSWARLIRRVYEVDPFLCRCGERMRVVGFITQAPVIRKILDHIGRRFDPPKLPGRSSPLFDDFCPDPFPDYGPQ